MTGKGREVGEGNHKCPSLLSVCSVLLSGVIAHLSRPAVTLWTSPGVSPQQ